LFEGSNDKIKREEFNTEDTEGGAYLRRQAQRVRRNLAGFGGKNRRAPRTCLRQAGCAVRYRVLGVSAIAAEEFSHLANTGRSVLRPY